MLGVGRNESWGTKERICERGWEWHSWLSQSRDFAELSEMRDVGSKWQSSSLLALLLLAPLLGKTGWSLSCYSFSMAREKKSINLSVLFWRFLDWKREETSEERRRTKEESEGSGERNSKRDQPNFYSKDFVCRLFSFHFFSPYIIRMQEKKGHEGYRMVRTERRIKENAMWCEKRNERKEGRIQKSKRW